MFQLINKIKKFFTKRKLVNNIDQSCYKFQLTPKQMEYIKNIEGDKEFIFKLNGIGYTTKMSCNGHLYDITDTNVW